MYKSIKLIYGDYPYFIKDSFIVYSVIGIKEDDNTEDITNSLNLTIKSLDANINIGDGNIYFNKTGSGIVKVYFLQNNEYLFDQVEFVVYETFFKDNYIKHLLSDFEAQNIEKKPMLKAIMDTCMEYIDIISAFNSDTKLMNEPMRIKSKYLYELGKSMGFEQFDNDMINTPLEDQANSMYRELLTNLYDLLRIRGTKTAYKLFFSALGYNINLDEFWFDDDGNLIEINPNDFLVNEENPQGLELSTYYAYTTDGKTIDSPPVPRNDPRNFSNPNNPYNRNTKSNYIRPVISVRDELGDGIIVDNPAAVSSKKRAIIKKFLEFLKPKHIQYLQELIQINIEQSGNNDLLENLLEEFLITDLFNFDIVPFEIENPNNKEKIKIIENRLILSLGKIIMDKIDTFLHWDSSIMVNGIKQKRKWDTQLLKWDTKGLIFENFLIQKR